MSPCGRTDGRTDEQTSENRATQSLDSVRLSFAIIETLCVCQDLKSAIPKFKTEAPCFIDFGVL